MRVHMRALSKAIRCAEASIAVTVGRTGKEGALFVTGIIRRLKIAHGKRASGRGNGAAIASIVGGGNPTARRAFIWCRVHVIENESANGRAIWAP